MLGLSKHYSTHWTEVIIDIYQGVLQVAMESSNELNKCDMF